MPMPEFTDGEVLYAAQLDTVADEVDRLETAKANTVHGHALTDANITGIIPVAQMPTIAVTKGGTGRTTSTTAYGLIAAGTTATGNQQTVAPGTAGHALVSAGAAALPAFRALLKTDVGLANVDNTTDANKPVSTATQTALNLKANLASLAPVATAGTFASLTGTVPTSALPPLAINEVFTVATQAAMLALTAQRGDMAIRTDTGSTFVLATDVPTVLANWKEIAAAGQVVSVAGRTGTVVLAKADVGLGSVDNTADSAKPVSTAVQTALNLKANLASPTFTGTVAGITAAMVGLGSVNNTADSAKPVSTAQQTALNLKANLASPTFTGTVAGITKAMVGLGSVDNTTDAAKPVSTAQQTALNAKAPLASPTFTGSVTVPTPTTVGQAATKGYVDTAVTGATVQVILVEAANWPPAADPNPNKWYVKVS